MGIQDKISYHFSVSGLSKEAFQVVSFKGREALSTPFEYQIVLASPDPDVDLGKAVQEPASFVIRIEDREIPVHGQLIEMDLVGTSHGLFYYRALLAPKLWTLKHRAGNQVFLDKTFPDILATVLKDGGLGADDFELRLSGSYPSLEYVCQYADTHFNFLSAWCEHLGISYHFEHQGGREKAVFTDHAQAHEAVGKGPVRFHAASGLEEGEGGAVVRSFVCRQRRVPAKVRLKDYNYLTPDADVSGEATVSGQGQGEIYSYGDHFASAAEGAGLAKVRAEELAWAGRVFLGKGDVPDLRPGWFFKLEGHFSQALNAEYLILEAEVSGEQPVDPQAAKAGKESKYESKFTAIPKEVQYRPPRLHHRPRFHGVIHAQVDAESGGQYAELDEMGRYKVRLPFDLAGKPGGKASHWIRLLQPYGGQDHGLHFPLLKGTEVLLVYMDGNPDRPVIAGAIPNAKAPSLVNADKSAINAMKTPSGNLLLMNDTKDLEHVGLWAPNQQTGILAGAHGPGWGGLTMHTDGKLTQQTNGDSEDVVKGQVTKFIGMADKKLTMGTGLKLSLGSDYQFGYSTGVRWNAADSYNLSPGGEFNLKTGATYGAFDEAVIGGGLSPAAKASFSGVYKAIITAVLSSGSSIAGQIMGANMVDTLLHMCKDFKGTFNNEIGKNTTSIIATILSAVGLIGPTIGNAVFLRGLGNTYKTSPKAGSIRMNSSGVAVKADPLAYPTAKIALTSGTPAANTLVQLSPQGESFFVNNQKRAFLNMLRGQKIELKIKGGASLTIDNGTITLKNPNGLIVEMKGNKTTLKATGGSVISLDNTCVQLSRSSHGIKLAQDGITLKYPAGQLKAGPLKINAAGVIQMG